MGYLHRVLYLHLKGGEIKYFPMRVDALDSLQGEVFEDQMLSEGDTIYFQVDGTYQKATITGFKYWTEGRPIMVCYDSAIYGANQVSSIAANEIVLWYPKK